MNWWNNPEFLNRLVLWLTVGTIVSPFLLGLSALAIKSRAKTLEDQRLEALRASNKTLEQDLEASKKQVAKLEERAAPWRLSAKQREQIRQSLAPIHSGRAIVICRLMDGEGCDFAGDLVGLLKDVGWEVIGPGSNSLNNFFGVDVFANSASGKLESADLLLAALRSAGIQCLSQPVAPNSIGGPLPEETVCVIVGRRPE